MSKRTERVESFIYMKPSGKYWAEMSVNGVKKCGTCRTTIEEARIDRDALKREQAVALKKRKREATPEINKAKFGDASAKERNTAWMIRTLVMPRWEVIVLNDQTHADVLVRPQGASEKWLPMQLKTANKSPDGHQRNLHWMFGNCTGYVQMPVLFWTLDCNHMWMLHDGAKMTAVAPRLYESDEDKNSGVLYKWNRVMDTHCTQSPTDVCAALDVAWAACPAEWRVTEWEARHNLPSKDAIKEMLGIDAWLAHYKPAKWSWPRDQAGSFDLWVDDVRPRKQFKTPSKHRNQCGHYVNLQKHAGKVNGKFTFRAYNEDDFDELIIMLVGTRWVDTWTIPRDALLAAGYLRTAEQAGVMSITVHLSEDYVEVVGGKRPRVKGDGKSGRLSKTLWTRNHHTRYELLQ